MAEIRICLARWTALLALSLVLVNPHIAWAQGPTPTAPGPDSTSQAHAASTPPRLDLHPYLSVAQLRAKYTDPKGKIATIKGVEIYYKDEGKGPVLLMVHGSASSLRTWDVIAARLKARYRIVRFDVGGMGLSGRVSDDAAAHATPLDIVNGLIDRLGVRRLTFVGVSSGGTLGMFLAAQRPELVERLILSNTPSDPVTYGHMTMPRSFLDAQALARAQGGFQSRAFWDEFMNYFSGVPARILPRTREEYYDFNRRIPEDHPIALTARIGDGKQADILMQQIKAPTLLIWGAADPLLPEAAMKALAGHLPNARISQVLLPDVGHYPPLEAPVRFERIMRAYIEAATP